MAKSGSSLPFNGTIEQQNKLEKVINLIDGDKSKLMYVLQQAQEIYGYLPMQVQKIIANGLDIPLEEVYGVVTFYAQFSLYPKGKYKVSVCLGTACYVKGS
ncbi:MAG: NAD(P)H-dependent oxidoreductase subunit E, partial [Oscillospiraceae bacterium]